MEEEKQPDSDQIPEEEMTTEKKITLQQVNKYDEISVQDKVIQLLPYEMLSDLVSTLVFELLLSPEKSYSKKKLEIDFEKMISGIKEGHLKISFIEMQKILEAISMVDMSENTANALWIGPDCINITGVTRSIMKTTKNIEDVVVDQYRAFKQSFPYELSQRESSFFLSLYHTLVQDANKQGIDKSWFTPTSKTYQENPYVDVFEKVGFAALKNKNVSYVIDKPVVIIGCSKKVRGGDFEWEVDLDLYPDPYVSKQHALLTYNFQIEKFEIKCLSSTNGIRVKDRMIYEKDEPRVLEENCFIRIGKQTLWFTITNEEEVNNEEIEEG